jgi:hypothetical protein
VSFFGGDGYGDVEFLYLRNAPKFMIAAAGIPATFALAVFLFLLFWMVAGVLFAVIAFSQSLRIEKARFGCFFTLATAGAAYGAAWSGLYVGGDSIAGCVERTRSVWERLFLIYGCAVLEISFASLVWFLALLIAGVALLFLSRTAGKSWSNKEK